uniref:Polyprotein n=1 Tax=Fusarium graminearum hypovirus 2 TaxID=1640379 RepID=A0A0E3SZJ4_9VIRU|nr:polyprotein [Fusarium graminearum hypovirus 2]
MISSMSNQLESGTLQTARSLSDRAECAYESVDFAWQAKNTTRPLTVLGEANHSEILSYGGNTVHPNKTPRSQIVTGNTERPSHLSPWFMRRGTRVPFRQAFVHSREGKMEGGAFWGSVVDGIGPLPRTSKKPAGYEMSAKLDAKRKRVAARRARDAQAGVQIDVDALYSLFSDRLTPSKPVRETPVRKSVRLSAREPRFPIVRLERNLVSGKSPVEEVWNDDIFHSVPAKDFKRARDSSMADIEPNPGPPPAYKGKPYGGQEPESEGFLLGKLARSPWASVTNGQDFYRHYQDVEFRERHDKYTKEDYANRLILALGLYAGFYAAENYLVRIPLFGFLIRIFYMILIDTPKVYGIVSCLYWHYYGDNSPIISALMPKDIFIWGKRFAMFIASNLPMWLVSVPLSPFFYSYYLLSFVVLPIEWLCQLIVSGKQNSEHPGSKEHAAPFDNPWDREVRTEEGRFQVALRQTTDLVLPPTHAGAEQQVVKNIPKPFVIKSAVGSGKSSLLPYALLNNARWLDQFRDLNAPTGGRVVLSLPRTILRDKWSSPLENDRQPIQRLKQGVTIDPRSKILIGTDGHLLNRVLAGELTDKDIFLLDEFHELNGQKVALLEELTQRKCTVMLPSATPKPVPGLEVGVMEAGIPRRFAPDIWPISDSISPADALRQFGGNFVTQWPVSGPPNAEAFKERVLVKCTHINGRNGVNETLEILQYDQWNCYALTSETARDPIPDSAQVVIATDVINTGISLPGFKLLVYDGKMHAVDQGEHSVTWVDPDTKHQGMARVGRYGPGDAVLCPVSAGTGPTPQVYPTMSYLHWSMNAQAHDLPQLCDFQGYATPELRRHYASTKLTPYLAVSTNLPANVRDAVSMYHAIANSGCRANEIRMVYTKLVSGKKVSESYELIEKFAADKSRVPVPYEAAVMAMAQEPVLYMCRNLTEKTLVPVATTLSTKLEPSEPALYDAYCAKTTGPLIPYRGRLRPLEEAESKVKNSFVMSKGTSPMELYDQIINIYESEAKEARDALSDAIKTVAEIKIKPSKNDPVTQVKNAIRKILATKFNALAKEQKISEPKASRLKVNLTEDSRLSPTLTYTTVDNVQYIHHHKKDCPLCDETGRHEHIGYNGAKNDAFDMRDEWFDALIEHDNFIFFHHGESVTNSQPEDRPKKIGDRKGKGRALSGASSTLNPSARAFFPPRLDLG